MNFAEAVTFVQNSVNAQTFTLERTPLSPAGVRDTALACMQAPDYVQARGPDTQSFDVRDSRGQIIGRVIVFYDEECAAIHSEPVLP